MKCQYCACSAVLQRGVLLSTVFLSFMTPSVIERLPGLRGDP